MSLSRIALVLALLWPLAAAPAQAAGPFDLQVSYSADSEVGAGDRARAGKLWRTPQMVRHETIENGRQEIVIARLDRQIAWILAPTLNVALETEISGLGQLNSLLSGGDKVKQTPVGQETVNGQATTKYRVETAGVADGRFSGFIWSTAQGVVVKIDGEGEYGGRKGPVQLSFRNIRIGPQESSLFEPPANYNRLKVSGAQIETVLRGMEQLQRLRGG